MKLPVPGLSHMNQSLIYKCWILITGYRGGALSVVEEGLKLHFKYQPPPSIDRRLPINPVPTGKIPDMDLLVDNLHSRSIIHRVDPVEGQVVSPIFLANKKPSGFRFILNLKNLNYHLAHQKIKMETLEQGLKLVTAGCWLGKVDLKDAYFSVKIHRQHRKFLRFAWQGILYEFDRLPNGLNQAPRAFSKLMKVVAAHLRSMGIKIVFYLDDLLIAAQESGGRDAKRSSVDCENIPQGVRFHNKRQKTVSKGNSVHRILRIRNRYFDDDSQTASKQTSQYYAEDNNSLCKNTGYSERGFSAVWYASGSRQGLASTKTALSKTSTADDIKATTKFPRLQCHSAPLRGISDGTQMVGGEPPTTANRRYPYPSGREAKSSDQQRPLPNGVWCVLSRRGYSRAVAERPQPSHQYSGDERCPDSSETFYKVFSRSQGDYVARQYDNHILHKQDTFLNLNNIIKVIIFWISLSCF